jgi:peptidoglycan/LPS O-acetylase OafA/YrhL
LSSFLLTYRLCQDFEKSQNVADIVNSTLKYLIRRFFRIYATVFVFIAFVQEPLYRLVSLRRSTFIDSLPYISLFGGYDSQTSPEIRNFIGQLWTIQVEIKFYFILPFFCLLICKMRKMWQHILIVSILFYANYRYTTHREMDFFELGNWSFHFLLGFTIAVLYKNWEELGNPFECLSEPYKSGYNIRCYF